MLVRHGPCRNCVPQLTHDACRGSSWGALALDSGVVALERGSTALLRERRSRRVRGASAAHGAARKLAVMRSRWLGRVCSPPRAGAEQDASSALVASAQARAGAVTYAPQACGCKACMCE